MCTSKKYVVFLPQKWYKIPMFGVSYLHKFSEPTKTNYIFEFCWSGSFYPCAFQLHKWQLQRFSSCSNLGIQGSTMPIFIKIGWKLANISAFEIENSDFQKTAFLGLFLGFNWVPFSNQEALAMLCLPGYAQNSYRPRCITGENLGKIPDRHSRLHGYYDRCTLFTGTAY